MSWHKSDEKQQATWQAAEDLARLFSGNLSKDDVNKISGWRQRSRTFQKEFTEISHLVGDLEALRNDPVVDRWLEDNNENQSPKNTLFSTYKIYTKSLLTAAALLVVAVGIVYWTSQNDAIFDQSYLYVTRVGEQKSIALPDGSLVNLNTNTQLSVNYTDNFRHLELLRGEAYFTVTKDAARPFRVVCKNRVVTVLGTEFNLWQSLEKMTLSVAEGLVALHDIGEKQIYAADILSVSGKQPVPLNNQQPYHIKAGVVAELDWMNNRMVAYADSGLKRKLSWREGTLRFEAATLAEVVQELNRYSTKEIRIMDKEIADLTLYSTFRTDRMDRALEGMAQSLPIRIENRRYTIEIYSQR